MKSIIPPPPPPPTFDHDPLPPAPLDLNGGSLEPANVPRLDARNEDDEDEELRESERLRRARQASMQRWAILVTAPLAIIAIAAGVRAAVIWGRAPTTEVSAANVATATATAIATAPPVVASAPPAPSPPPEAEPPPPSPKVATPPAAPILVTAEEQVARDRAAAKKEKFEAQAALEVGDGRRAQRAAKRATALDPSDAHGWLLLVAAELDCKNPVAANDALRSCLERATRGPRGECIGMVVGRAARAKKVMDVKALSTMEPPDMPPPATSH